MKAFQSELGKAILKDGDASSSLRKILHGEDENLLSFEDGVYRVMYKFINGLEIPVSTGEKHGKD